MLVGVICRFRDTHTLQDMRNGRGLRRMVLFNLEIYRLPTLP